MRESSVKRKLVTIVLLTRNNLNFTRRCLEGVRSFTKHPYKILVVDSASKDGTVEYLRKQSNVELIENEEDVRIPTALNEALEFLGDSEYFCKLDNDIVPMSGWLTEMVFLAESSPSIGTVGAKLLRENYSIQHAGGIVYNWRMLPENSKAWRFSHYTRDAPTRRCPWVTGACFLTKREVIERLGKFDESYPFWFEEVDYCFRARKAGFKVMYCREAKLLHFEQSRFKLRQEVYEAHRIFVNKWKRDKGLWTNKTDTNALLWAITHDPMYFFTLLDLPHPSFANYVLRFVKGKKQRAMCS